MTGAQLAARPRPPYIKSREPRKRRRLKKQEEFQAKVETTKTAASTKKKKKKTHGEEETGHHFGEVCVEGVEELRWNHLNIPRSNIVEDG